MYFLPGICFSKRFSHYSGQKNTRSTTWIHLPVLNRCVRQKPFNLLLNTLMRKFYTLCMFMMAAFVGTGASAQDMIYQIDERKIPCKLLEVNAKKVRYNKPENPGVPYALDKNLLLMAFSENGNYLVFSETEGDAASTGSSSTFLTAPKRNFDVLVTIDNQVIASKIEKAGDLDISYKKYNPTTHAVEGSALTLNKTNLLIILYQDGRISYLLVQQKPPPY